MKLGVVPRRCFDVENRSLERSKMYFEVSFLNGKIFRKLYESPGGNQVDGLPPAPSNTAALVG